MLQEENSRQAQKVCCVIIIIIHIILPLPRAWLCCKIIVTARCLTLQLSEVIRLLSCILVIRDPVYEAQRIIFFLVQWSMSWGIHFLLLCF